jgi:hypothetical protein
MFKINFIMSKLAELTHAYNQIKALIWNSELSETSLSEAEPHFKKSIKLISQIRDFIKQDFLSKTYATEFNKLKLAHVKLILTQLSDVLNLLFKLLNKFKESKSNENFKFYVDLIVRNAFVKIKKYIGEPFSYFPDVSLWFMFNSQPVGVTNFKCSDVVWSQDEHKRGCVSGKMLNTDVKSLKVNDFDNPETKDIARIKVFTWMGALDEVDAVLKERIKSCNLEYDEQDVNDLQLPRFVYYDGEFQLN